MVDNIFREPADQVDEAHTALITTANELRRCLRRLNEYGDHIGPTLAVQADGFAYGEIYDGFKILMRALFPDDGVKDRHLQIIDATYDSDFTIEEAVQHVNDMNSPKWGYPDDDVRADLNRYRAYLIALDDGVLKADRVIGVDDPDEARKWLNQEIDDCLGALAYRNEPEVKPSE